MPVMLYASPTHYTGQHENVPIEVTAYEHSVAMFY
jgi:hypothetical protein